MRQSLNLLPCFSNNPSPRGSPVLNNQLRNPFEKILSTGSIKPVCHRSKFLASRAYSPDLLINLSPRSPVKLPKISSEGKYKKINNRGCIVHKSVKFIEKYNEQPIKTPFFLEKISNLKDFTFGAINNGQNRYIN